MRLLVAAIMMSLAATAYAQSSSSSGGGSSGSAKTEAAPRQSTAPSTLGGGSTTMGGGSAAIGEDTQRSQEGIAPGSGRRPGGQTARMPDECTGPVTDPRCSQAGAPTGTGLGDRGIGQGQRDRYGPEDSPVKGGPPFEQGPTGRPLNLPY